VKKINWICKGETKMPAVKERNEDSIKSLISQRLEQGHKIAEKDEWKDFIKQSCSAYHDYKQTNMPEFRKAILANSLERFREVCVAKGISKQAIREAAENISDVENPISMMFNLMAILIPNFAYMDFAGVQPMPTEESPIFFPTLEANTDRNGVTKGTSLLGAFGWSPNHNYTSNRWTKVPLSVTNASPTVTYTAVNGPIKPGSIKIKVVIANGGTPLTSYIVDDKAGNLIVQTGTLVLVGASSVVDYDAKTITITKSTNFVTGDTAMLMEYRYDLNAYEPAQVLYKWSTISMGAEPYRIRSMYSLDNYYAVKQVLKDYDIAQAMSTTIAGYINKEISCSVFEDALDQVDLIGTFSYNTIPDGVSWAFHRLQLLEKVIKQANTMRSLIARGQGNVIAAGTDFMNIIETLDATIWAPKKYDREPIGPYNAGVLQNKFTIIKDQDLPHDMSVMTYKAEDTDASFGMGVFIGLYATDPLAFDDLNVKRGMGSKLAKKKIIPNGLAAIQIV
jgi:hypothetical protein